METFKPIQTSRLILRQVKMEDDWGLYSYRCHPEVKRYQTWHPSSIDDIHAFIHATEATKINEEGKWLQVVVCLKQTSQVIGDIGIHFIPDEPDQVEIGYTVSPVHQRKGYAFEAVQAILERLFSIYKKHRVFASVDPFNIPSIALLEKLGLRKEAHFVKNMLVDGKWVDDCIYAMLYEEWSQY